MKQTSTRSWRGKQCSSERDSISLQFYGEQSSTQAISGNLSCPLHSGQWEHFDFEHDQIYAYVLMQMVIITGVLNTNDFQFSFVNKRTFKIRMKWPRYMQKCMMMTSLDVDVDQDRN